MKMKPHAQRELRVLKTGQDYESALNELEILILKDPEPGTSDADLLELLTVLAREYEARTFRFDAIDPIDAIEFRMEEQGLRQKDLAPLLGGKNRVSEVLARKRALTLDMIRALHAGLGIPLSVLVAPEKPRSSGDVDSANADDKYEWGKFPIAEMRKRGWFDGIATTGVHDAERLVQAFLEQVSGHVNAVPALFRRTFRGNGSSSISRYSLIAWTARILIRAKQLEKGAANFVAERLDAVAFRELARFSSFRDGPTLAENFLHAHGVILVVEAALPSTLVDGAALMMETGRAVIGLTLRHDRVDNFWFTLLHELAHVRNHLQGASVAFVDRIDDEAMDDPIEREANQIAREALIPRAHWHTSTVSVSPTKKGILAFAEELNVHPAIVAGRVRFESKRFDRFGDMLGQGEVKAHFSAVRTQATE